MEEKSNKLERLDLTEAQLTAINVIKTAAKANSEETKAKLKTYKQAKRALIHSTGFNTEAWQILSNEYQVDFLAIAVLKAKKKHAIWNLLQAEAKKNNKRNKGKKGKKHQQR